MSQLARAATAALSSSQQERVLLCWKARLLRLGLRGGPDGAAPANVALSARHEMPVQMGNHVAEQLDVHVIRLHHFDQRVVRQVQVRGICGPLLRRELIQAHDVPRVEHEQAVAAIGLVCGKVE